MNELPWLVIFLFEIARWMLGGIWWCLSFIPAIWWAFLLLFWLLFRAAQGFNHLLSRIERIEQQLENEEVDKEVDEE